MSVQKRSDLQALYGTSGSQFNDNTTGDITPTRMRGFGQNYTDSHFNLLDDKYTGAGGLYLNITDTTGLKAVVTVGVSVNIIIFFASSGLALSSYKLISGTDAESLPNIVRPTDYDGASNQKVWKLVSPSGSGTISGLTATRIPYASSATALADDSNLNWDNTNKRLGIGTASPSRRVHASIDDASNNTVTYVQRLTHTTSGSPANGIGTGLEFEAETGGGNTIGATIEAIVTDVTNGSEDYDFVFKLRTAGAALAEKFRFKSTGDFSVNGSVGTSGQVLTSGGSSASPTWTNIISGLTTTYLPLATSSTALGNSEITKSSTGFYIINTNVNGNAEFLVNNTSTLSNATSYLSAQAGTSEVDLISYGQNTSTPGLAELKNNSGDLKLTASGGNINVGNANIKLQTAGNGFYVKEGTNACMGTATLSGGTTTVNTTKVTANSRIFLTNEGGTITNLGTIYVSARSAGTSFTVTSTNALDTSTFIWIIFEPS